jgi:hypothetical protein
MTTLTADQFSSQLDLSAKTILLPVETDAVVHYVDRTDFPTTGRLKRLYVQQNSGVVWAWTGTTYQKTSPTTDEFAALQGEVDLAETSVVTERNARIAAISSEATARVNADADLSSSISAVSSDLTNAITSVSAIESRVSTNESAISITLPGLIADAEGFVQHGTYSDFPATGRLNRLYVARDNGTLWRWTGTTYSPVPGEQDGGTY